MTPAISGDRVVWQDDRYGPFEIFLYDLITGEEQLTDTGDEKPSLAIDGTKVAWPVMTSGTTSDIYLGLNMAGLGSPRSIIATGGVNDLPKISSDNVVWQKFTGGHYDIYLHNTSSPAPCPVASFTANVTSGVAPLGVQFNDTSGDTTITSWTWEFGDGTTSHEKNATHTYHDDRAYSVALTVGSPVGRDYATRTGYIRVGPAPLVSFQANQTTGTAPFPVQFTDTSSGSPTGRAWDFGDGETSTETNPVHEYASPGTCTVTLTATNAYGTGSGTLAEPIRVMNGISRRATTDIPGLLVTLSGGRQEITLDTGLMDGNSYDPAVPASFSFTPPSAGGWRRMIFSSSDGIGFAMDGGGVIRGNLSSCTLESLELVPGTFGPDIGNNLPVSYRLDLGSYPVHASVNATVWENVTPADALAFRHALVTKSTQFTSVMDFAYTLDFVVENIDPPSVNGASLNLSVASSWVASAGGGNNITVIRLGEGGSEEVLNPSAMTSDTGAGLEHFAVSSPHGLSRFALVSATGSSNLIQMGARVVTQYIQGSGMGVSSSQPSARDRTGWEQPAPAAEAPEAPAASYYGDGKLDTTPAGITRAPVIVASEDRGASLSIGAGATALDAAGNPLTSLTVRAAPAGSVPPGPGGAGDLLTGLVYDLGPDGATFDPPATVSFTIPVNLWDPLAQYNLRSYSAQTGSWEDIPTSMDPAGRVVSGRVSHLCLFGLFSAAPAPATTAPAGQPAAAGPATQPGPIPRTPMGIFTGLLAWIYATGVANPLGGALVLVIAALLALVFIATKRRSRITRIPRKR